MTEFNSPSQFFVQRIDEQASSKLPRVSNITCESYPFILNMIHSIWKAMRLADGIMSYYMTKLSNQCF